MIRRLRGWLAGQPTRPEDPFTAALDLHRRRTRALQRAALLAGTERS